MSDATKRKCGCDWSLWETCDECNPDDEAAEIRRLRTRLAESEAEVAASAESYRKKCEEAQAWAARLDAAARVSPMIKHNADLISKCLAAEAERDDLLGALREVVGRLDTMFLGAVTQEAVDRARAAIAKVGGP